MYVDAQNRFSNDQAVTTGTQLSTNNIDMLSANKNIGIGIEGRIVAHVTTTFTGGTSIRAEVIQSASADMSSPDILVTGPTLLEAAAVDGAVLLDVKLPNTTKRYVGVRYITVGTHGAGTVHSAIVAETDHMPFPPANTGY